MPSNRIDQNASADAARHLRVNESLKKLLSLQGAGLWVGDLAEMRRDTRNRAEENTRPDVAEHE
jgi:hypothetical protein